MRELFWKRVLDAQDRVVRIPPPRGLYQRGCRGEDGLDELRAAVYGLPSGRLARGIFGFVLACFAFGAIYRVTLEHMGVTDANRSGVILGSAVAVAAFIAAMRLGVQPPDMMRVWQAFAACLCCPRCGYDLRSLPLNEQRDAVCPECGSAWRMPDDHKPPHEQPIDVALDEVDG